jgi:aspartate kinase
MASYLQAACEVYKDVDGVFTADPRVVPGARLLAEVSFEEMAELAEAGAQVLARRSVEYGRRLGVPLHVRSSFHEGEGTWVREGVGSNRPVTGVAHAPGQALVGFADIADSPSARAELDSALAGAGVEADLVGLVGSGEPGDIGCVVPAEQSGATRRAAAGVGSGRVAIRAPLGKVSVVGEGLRSDPGLAARVPGVLVGAGVEVVAVATRPIRVSCLVPEGGLEESVRLLHRAFVEEER